MLDTQIIKKCFRPDVTLTVRYFSLFRNTTDGSGCYSVDHGSQILLVSGCELPALQLDIDAPH
jgi:hypothetical protein